jgi:outer membrane protein TolC
MLLFFVTTGATFQEINTTSDKSANVSKSKFDQSVAGELARFYGNDTPHGTEATAELNVPGLHKNQAEKTGSIAKQPTVAVSDLSFGPLPGDSMSVELTQLPVVGNGDSPRTGTFAQEEGSFDPKIARFSRVSFDGQPPLPPLDPDVHESIGQSELDSDETWWRNGVREPFCQLPHAETLDVATLVHLTLRGSKHLQAISQEPLIRELDIAIARSNFDPNLFARTLYDDRTDPVGNTLTTGGLPFLKDNIWTGQTGVKRKLFAGGNVEVSQLIGFQNSNSRFFVPQDQGTATLSLNYQQPLLRGAGKFYNCSQIVMAQVNSGASWNHVAAKVQDELARAAITYWELYSKRASYLQKHRNYERSLGILERLEARAQYDTQALQIAQARAAVTARKMELANALRDVRNTETEIRRIVGDADWVRQQSVELLTIESPVVVDEHFDLESAVQTSLANRPELRQAVQRVRVAAIKSNVSRNEILPDLSLLFGTYVKGLAGDSRIEQAWTEQFNNSTPGYSVGLQYAFPWQNRAATSRNRQTQLELIRQQNELEQTTIDIVTETQQNHRRLASGMETLNAAQVALNAAQAELNQVLARWESFAIVEGDWSEGQTQSLLLDQLLAAQQKLTTSESIVTESEKEVKTAQIALRRSMGVLLTYYQVSTDTVIINGTCQVDLHSDVGVVPAPLGTNGPANVPEPATK